VMFDHIWTWWLIGAYFGGWLATFLHLRHILLYDANGEPHMPLWQEIICDALFALTWPFLMALLFYSWIMDLSR
jgi:hypothetical protein